MLVMVVFFIAFRWIHLSTPLIRLFLLVLILLLMPTDRKSGSAGMPRPISYAVFCLKKKSESDLTFSVYNVYNRRNPYFIYYAEVKDPSTKAVTGFRAKQVSLFFFF